MERVATTAAKKTEELNEERSMNKDELRIGVGGGWTTMLMARRLAALLHSEKQLPTSLTIHALSTGFDVHAPHTAPLLW